MRRIPIINKKYNCYAILIGILIYIMTKIGIKLGIQTPYYLARIWDIGEAAHIELFLGQVSISFIVPSLLTVLGDKSVTILWQNVVDYKLIEPKNKSFKDITGYSFSNLVFSFIAILINNPFMLLFYFLWNAICLVWMTHKMIDVYFDTNKIRAEIIATFEMDSEENKSKKIRILYENIFGNVDDNKFIAVEDGIAFLSTRSCYSTELIEVLDYVRKNNEVKYWEYVRKYDVSKDKDIKKITIETCEGLIRKHQNSELVLKIVQDTFTTSEIEETLRKIENYSEMDIGCLVYVDQNAILAARNSEEKYKELESFLAPSIKRINTQLNSIDYNFPINLLYYSALEKNIEVFDYLLKYMTKYYIEVKEKIRNCIKESLRKGEDFYFSEPFADYYAFSVIRNIYTSHIVIEIMSNYDKERIQRLASDDNSFFILDEQRKNLNMLIKEINCDE